MVEGPDEQGALTPGTALGSDFAAQVPEPFAQKVVEEARRSADDACASWQAPPRQRPAHNRLPRAATFQSENGMAEEPRPSAGWPKRRGRAQGEIAGASADAHRSYGKGMRMTALRKPSRVNAPGGCGGISRL
jgi:hypothetical protein